MSRKKLNKEGDLLISDVFLYKTRAKRYDKFQVLNYEEDERLTIRAVTYNEDGTVYKQIDHLKIRGTWYCDLDDMLEGGSESDFQWERHCGTTTISPVGKASFVKVKTQPLK